MDKGKNKSNPIFQKLIILIGIIVLFFDSIIGFVLIGLGIVLIFVEQIETNKRLKKAAKQIKARENFSFIISAAESELLKCQLGEQVNWWAPDDKSKIIFYKRGTYGGEGKIGEVPKKIVDDILKLKEEGNELKFFVFGTKVKATIEKQEVLREELRLKTEQERERLIKMFGRKYKPKGTIEIRVQHNLGCELLKFTETKMEVKDKDFYINHPNDIFIDFIIDGRRIRKNNEKSTLLRIIRTHFEGYEQKVELTDSHYHSVDLVITPLEKKPNET